MPLIPTQEPPYYQIDEINPTGETKIYAAILSQTGTDAPTAIIAKNTLDSTPVWTYVSTGQYALTLTEAFPITKTIVLLGSVYYGGRAAVIDENTIKVYTANAAGSPLDGELDNTGIQIIVYP